MKIADAVLDLIFPPRCAICDDILPWRSKYTCPQCRKKLVYIKEPYCMKCGKELTEDAEYCSDCKSRKHMFIQGSAVFDYGSVANSLFRFKNKGRAEYAAFYARELFEQKGDYLRSIRPDALIPVPIHPSKKRMRGYNQSELIARELSKLTGIPVNTTLIIRTQKTPPLKELSLKERQNYLKNAFKVGVNDVKLRSIVIIDDIYTTGSTMDEMSRAVLELCNIKIYFLTVTIGRGV